MNARVLAAGWPFAGLLALDAVRAEVSAEAPGRCLITVETVREKNGEEWVTTKVRVLRRASSPRPGGG